MKSYRFSYPLLFIICVFFFAADTKAQLCATDEIHEGLMATDPQYAQHYQEMNQAIRTKLSSKSLSLDNSTQVTIPLVVHVIHTGGAIGSTYNPSDAAIIDAIDGLNDFYANANGQGVDINIQFVLAKRDENCSAATGINRVDASGLAGYTAHGVNRSNNNGITDLAMKDLSRWSNQDYYNVWLVNKIDSRDGITGSGSYVAGYAYYPGASKEIDGMVMLASHLNPLSTTLAHEIGHALNLAHTFNGDGDGSTCPTNNNCAADGDYCCDTAPHKRNSFQCITTGTTCTGDAVGDVYKNIMSYSMCEDRFTNDQRSRMRAALETSRPGLVSSRGGESPLAAVAGACIPTIIAANNGYSMGPRQFDFGDSRTTPGPYGWYGNTEYRDMSCTQQYTVYPGQGIPMAVSTGGNRQRVRIYIDYNNNGVLDNAGELVFSAIDPYANYTHSGTITIPANATTNTPLRMRLWADWYGGGGFDGPCGDIGYGQAVDYSIVIDPTNSWTGTVSTDWANANNWSAGVVPAAVSDVTIPAAASNQPSITAAPGSPARCATLTIENGATLTVDAGKALTISGNTSNEGTILVKADATGIGSLITEGTITGSGSFQMEQYLTGSGATTPNGVFHYVGSPVTGAQAAGYELVSGNKLWSYSEVGNGYTQIVSGATTLSPLAGYTVRAGSDGSRTLSGSSFNTGTQSASLSRTGTSNGKRGYHLVSNPYPSTVNWDGATRTNLETTIWYRTNQNGTMVFDTYNANGSIGTNNNQGGTVTGNIPPGQAVWVRVDADGNTGTLGFTNANRSHGAVTSIYKTEVQEGVVRMTLSNDVNSDEAILLFNTDAQDGFDDFDSRKYWSSNVPQLYMNVAEDTLTINGLSSTITNPVVDLGMKLPTAGDYMLQATSITLTNENVYLEDKMLGVFQDLNVEPSYAFTSTNGNISSRFALHFGMSVTDIEDGTHASSRVYTSNGNTLNIILSENTATGNVQVLDMTGRIIHTTNLNTSRSAFHVNAATGVYLIRVETEKGMDTHRVILN